MKKNLLMGLMVLSASLLFAKPLEYIESGSYGYYVDNRVENSYVRGYLVCHVDDGTAAVFMNTINQKTGGAYKGTVLLSESEDSELNVENMQFSDFPEEEKNQVMQTYIDLLNFDSFYRNSAKKIDFDSVLEDKWDGYSLYYHYSKLFPMFKFSQISFDDAKLNNVVYYVRRFGKIPSFDSNGISYFYENPETEFVPAKRNLEITIPKAAKNKVKLADISFNLDKNWIENEFNGNVSWWLQIESVRDAQLMVEALPAEIVLDTLDKKMNLAQKMISAIPKILPESLKIWKQNNDIYMSYNVYDENNVLSRTILGFKTNSLINFSAFEDVYLQNESYFKKILGIK